MNLPNIPAMLRQFGYAYYPDIIRSQDQLEAITAAVLPAAPQSHQQAAQMLGEYFPAMIARRAADLALYVESGQWGTGQTAYDDPLMETEYQILHGGLAASFLKDSLNWLVEVIRTDSIPDLPGDRATTAPYVMHEATMCLTQLRIDLENNQVDISKVGPTDSRGVAARRTQWLNDALNANDITTAQNGADAFMIQDVISLFAQLSDVLQQKYSS